LNNEVNGLTMGGVGSGTTIEYVQVSYSSDDSFEWFGGTVNCKYLVAFGGTDDDWDTDFGYSGKLQFLFSLRDPNTWDPTGESNGFESDNDGSGTTASPRTAPVFANVTSIGPQRTNATAFTPGNRYQYSLVLRRRTQLKEFNSVHAGYPGGLSIRDENLQELRGVTLYASPATTYALYHGSGTGQSNANTQTFFTVTMSDNDGAVNGPDAVGFSNMSDLFNPDPRPTGGSTLVTDPVYAYTNAPLSDPFFTAVAYRGAFAPAPATPWTAGWTSFNIGQQGSQTVSYEAGWNLISMPRWPSNTDVRTVLGASPAPETGTVNGWSITSQSYVTETGGGGTLTNLVVGAGYWAKYTSTSSETWAGFSVGSHSVPAVFTGTTDIKRWVLVGGVTSVTAVNKLQTVREGSSTPQDFIDPGTIYGYSESNPAKYFNPTTLDPGKAYWVLIRPPTSGTQINVSVAQ
jgi:hypothetical protein